MFCGCKEVRKYEVLAEFPTGYGTINRLVWAACAGCNEHYRQRIVLEKQ